MKKKRAPFTQLQIIALGFGIVILLGALLLMLPCATAEGEKTTFLDALFTAVSASCVTGLVVADTFLHWTWFGRTVILTLIQIGGLGFVSIGVFFASLFRRKISLRERGLMQESVNALHISGMVKLTRFIIKGTLLIEGLGAFLLAFRFVPEYGWSVGLYFSVFHAVSAFCNAGFDLMGHRGAYGSFVSYQGDIYVNLILMALILIGGLGFLVWYDLRNKKFSFRNLELHTKIILLMTGILVVVPTILFWILERNNVLAGMSPGRQALVSLFSAVTPRTAGFNTVDTAALTESSQLLTIVLMFIGGGPGSTAGGIKTTTFLMILLYIIANFRGRKSCNIFGRRLDKSGIHKATVVFGINLFLAVFVAFCISAISKLPMMDILFESFSAIGTVGMTTGITRDLNGICRILIAFLMYCGRIGSLSFATSIFENKREAPVLNPVERIRIG